MAFKLRINRVESLRIEENTVDMTAVNMADKSNESRQTAPESLRSFMDDTTLHGARFLFVGNIFRRFLWTLALISCFGYCVWQVYQAVDEFEKRPLVTKITTKTPSKSEHLPFPAVTLCNYNTFNRRRFITELPRIGNRWSTEVIQQKINIYEKMMLGSREIINLKIPYSTNCTNRGLEMFRNTRYTYSQPACMLQCLTLFVIRKCGCRPIEYKDTDIPLCSPKDVAFCIFPIYETFGASKEKEKCVENCAQPCTYTKYETSLSYSGLQRNVFINKLNSAAKETAIYEHFLNMSTSKKKEYIDENIIALEVYFEDLSYDEIEQTPKFETWTLISTLGGNFGLFLGMSILTILEFVDFTFRRICFLICKI